LTTRPIKIHRAAGLLETLARRSCRTVDARAIAVVVAHPDDETIGCVAMMRRLKGVSVIQTTNGAPSRSEFWRRKGFSSAEAYSLVRRAGLERALSLVGIPPERLLTFGLNDQETTFGLVVLTRWLKAWLYERSIEVVMTQAYEGGHPDHDATAFAVHAAVQLMQREHGRTLEIIEMPFYRLSASGPVVQDFDRNVGRDVVEIELCDEDVDLKRRMFDAHVSQATTLKRFGTEIESYRFAPDYDFGALPNGGDILYDSRNWLIQSDQWLRLSRLALRDLGLLQPALISNRQHQRRPKRLQPLLHAMPIVFAGA
jgi:N-acetylglucosamine malate deacetylase 2